MWLPEHFARVFPFLAPRLRFSASDHLFVLDWLTTSFGVIASFNLPSSRCTVLLFFQWNRDLADLNPLPVILPWAGSWDCL